MENKKILFLIILLCIIQNGLCQNSSIIFCSDKEVSISIYAPIDDAVNFRIKSKEIELIPHVSVEYSLPVSDFSFLRYHFSDDRVYDILLLEGDTYFAKYTNEGLIIEESNSKGNNFQDSIGVRDYMTHLSNLPSFKGNVQQSLNDLQDSIMLIYNTHIPTINTMEANREITPRYATILRNEIHCIIRGLTFDYCYMLLFDENREDKLNGVDSIIIYNTIMDMYKQEPFVDGDLYKYKSFSASKYYGLKYEYLSQDDKNYVLGEYSDDTFGPYVYTLASSKMRQIDLGMAFVIQILYNKYTMICHSSLEIGWGFQSRF